MKSKKKTTRKKAVIAMPRKVGLRIGKDGYLLKHEDLLRLENMGRHIAHVQPIIVNEIVSLVNYSNDLKNILERMKRKYL